MATVNPPPDPFSQSVRDVLKGKGKGVGATLFIRNDNIGPVTYLYAAVVGKPVTLKDLNDPLSAIAGLCKNCGSIGIVTFAHQGDRLRIGRVSIEEKADPVTKSVIIMLYPTIVVASSRLKKKSPFSTLPFEVPTSEVFEGLRSA